MNNIVLPKKYKEEINQLYKEGKIPVTLCNLILKYDNVKSACTKYKVVLLNLNNIYRNTFSLASGKTSAIVVGHYNDSEIRIHKNLIETDPVKYIIAEVEKRNEPVEAAAQQPISNNTENTEQVSSDTNTAEETTTVQQKPISPEQAKEELDKVVKTMFWNINDEYANEISKTLIPYEQELSQMPTPIINNASISNELDEFIVNLPVFQNKEQYGGQFGGLCPIHNYNGRTSIELSDYGCNIRLQYNKSQVIDHINTRLLMQYMKNYSSEYDDGDPEEFEFDVEKWEEGNIKLQTASLSLFKQQLNVLQYGKIFDSIYNRSNIKETEQRIFKEYGIDKTLLQKYFMYYKSSSSYDFEFSKDFEQIWPWETVKRNDLFPCEYVASFGYGGEEEYKTKYIYYSYKLKKLFAL